VRVAVLAGLLAAGLAGCGGARRGAAKAGGGPSRAGEAPTAAPARPASAASARSASARSAGEPIVEYAASWDEAAGELSIDARVRAGVQGGAFTVDRGAEDFVRGAEASAGAGSASSVSSAKSESAGAGSASSGGSAAGAVVWTPMARRGRRFEAAACARSACRVRYRFALREAARAIQDVDVATEEDGLVEAPPSTWLLVPADAPRSAPVRFRVKTPEGSRFVTGVLRARESSDAWDISLDDLWTAPYSAFGPLRTQRVSVASAPKAAGASTGAGASAAAGAPAGADGGSIEVAIGPGALALDDAALGAWVSGAARAIEAYFGRFPMPGALVLLVPSRGRWIGGGKTLAGGGGTIWIRAGERAPARAYADDWVLVHEMTHLTFPSVPREHQWAEEGLATYVEPFARVRAGLVGEAEAWRGLLAGLPKGLPKAGDEGLDRTHTWGRTYWGGALFWFLADVRIRERTKNRFGLERALRGILAAGGSNAVRWSLDEALDAGDRAVGVPVLRELHAQMGAAPYPVDLGVLEAKLGVSLAGGTARFDDAAPLAAVRRAIARGGP
jgi:hypothetical protein